VNETTGEIYPIAFLGMEGVATKDSIITPSVSNMKLLTLGGYIGHLIPVNSFTLYL